MVLFHLVIQIASGYSQRLRGLGFVPAIKLQRPFDRLLFRLISNSLQRLDLAAAIFFSFLLGQHFHNVVFFDPIAAAKICAPVDDIEQLANISRPAVIVKNFHSAFGDALYILINDLDLMLSQQSYILFSLPQRRYPQFDNV